MSKIFLSIAMMCVFLGYGSVPAPVVQPDGVTFDPNAMPSPVMKAFNCWLGVEKSGEFDCEFTRGNTITATADAGMTLSLKSSIILIDDPNITKNTYIWKCTPATLGVKGYNIKVEDISVTDSEDKHPKDERTIVIFAKRYQKPVITGCRGN